MAVNPDEILIFKMRGIKKQEQRPAPAKETPKPTPQPLPVAVKEPMETAIKMESPLEVHPVFAQPEEVKEQPARPAASEAPEPVQMPAPKPKERPIPRPRQPWMLFAKKEKPKPRPKIEEKTLVEAFEKPPVPQELEEEQIQDVQALEQQVYGVIPEQIEQIPTLTAEAPNPFGPLAGIILLANSVIFGYFIYPQATFVMSYAARIGFGVFISNLNFDYGLTFLNLVLVVLGLIASIMMLGRLRIGNVFGGAVGAAILLSLTFEYLNSGAQYLLVVCIIAFFGIAALAFSRMSAVSAEKEDIRIADINWPKIETF